MKRMMPIAVAGLFVATAALATVGHETPMIHQHDALVTDTVPDQDTLPDQDQTAPPATFPTQTEPADTEPNPMVTEPTKTDDQTQVEDSTTVPAWDQQPDTIAPDTTDGF